MIQALVYVRVSSRKQEEEGHGLTSQENVCREYASRKGLSIVAVYSDTYTGGSTRRDGLQKLLQHVHRHRGTRFAVLFDDISRLTRDLRGHLEITDQLRKAGCLLLSPSREFNDDADSILVENLLAAMSQHNRSKNREQVVNRMTGRLLGGNWPFRLPYGLIHKNGVFLQDKPHFGIVREALEGFASGALDSHAAVRRWLLEQEPFVKRHKGVVTIQRVERLLRNLLYSGYLSYPKWGVGLRKANIPAAIDLATHDRIISILDGRKKGPRLSRYEFFLRAVICVAPIVVDG